MINRLLVGLLVFLLAGCSSYVPLTSVPIATRYSTYTPFPVDHNILYTDDFSNNGSGWMKLDETNRKFFYADGQYHIYISKSDLGGCSYIDQSFSDAIISIETRQISGNNTKSAVGIVYRMGKNKNGYMLTFDNSGNYWVNKYINNEPNPLLQYSQTSLLLTNGATNKIIISTKGENTDFYFNNNYVTSVKDSSSSSGVIQLCVFSGPEGDTEYAFDNFAVYKYDLTNSYTPIKPDIKPTPILHSITWIELADFLISDHTNWNKYDINTYNCVDFAIDLVENAQNQNINAWIVGVDFTNGDIGHAFVAFDTSDKGIVYVEPQGDNTYSNVVVGNWLCDDWGKFECMGIINSIEKAGECTHDHKCTRD